MSTELVKVDGNKKADPVLFKQYMSSHSDEISTYLENQVETERFIGLVSKYVANNYQLQQCTAYTVWKAAMDLLDVGLDLSSVTAEAYLVPISGQCKLWISYRGWVNLLRRSGFVDDVWAEAVYHSDREFDIQRGSEPHISHLPNLDGAEDEKDFRGAYCCIKLKGVARPNFQYMSKAKIDKIRKDRKGGKAGDTWDTSYVQMAIKTVIKRAVKLMDMKGMSSKLARALEIEEEQDRQDYPQYTNSPESHEETVKPNRGTEALLAKVCGDEDVQDTTSTPLSVTENAQTTERAETPEPAPEERITSIKNKLTELKWTKQVVIDTLGVYKVPGLWTHDDCDKLKHWCDVREALSSADSATVSLESPVSPSGESAPVSETVLTQEQADLLAEYVGTAEGTLSKLNSMCGRQFADCSTIEQAFAKICELHIDKVKNAIKIAMATAKAKKDAAE